MKFTAAMVRHVVDAYALERVRTVFGVSLSDKTAAQRETAFYRKAGR